MIKEKDPTKDWRGTPITPGAPCIYGAPVGRSIELVEGEVVGFTKSGRVNVKVIRRGYQTAWGNDKKVVHVGHDRLIIINPDTLPPTTLPTWEELGDQKLREQAERAANYASHTGEELVDNPAFNYREGIREPRFIRPPCQVCGAVGYERGQRRCTDDTPTA